jgi:hypothetical protein
LSLTEPTLADPVTAADAWKQAAERVTPFGQYLGEKILGGLEGTRVGSSLEEAMLPGRLHGDMATVIGGGTSEFGVQSPGMGVVGPTEGPAMMPKADWEASPHFRPSLTWDEGMTPARAEALATQHDRLEWNKSLVARSDAGWLGQAAGFVAGLAPGVADPTNYIPLLGPAAKAAMVARLGVIGGNVALHGAEAAANTALFEPLTASHAATFGQPYGLTDAATDIALAAVAGMVGGAIHGGLEYRGGLREAATRTRVDGLLRASDALNVVADQLDRGEPANVAPVMQGFDVGRIVPRRAAEGAPEGVPGMSGVDLGPTVPRRAGETPAERPAPPSQTGLDEAPASPAGDDRSRYEGGLPADLDLGRDARTARAREQGYNVDYPLYHGSNADIEAFRPSERGAIGPGVYTTPQAMVAERYGDAVYPVYTRGKIFNASGSALKGLNDFYVSSSITEHDVNKLFEGVSHEKISPRILSNLKEYGEAAGDAVWYSLRSAVGKEEAQSRIKELGYRHILSNEDGHEVVTFDPADIRSVHATFSPDEGPSANILGRRGPPSFATATPEPPHPSVAEAAKRVGKAADPLATFKVDAGLEGYQAPLPGHEPKPEPGTPEAERAAKPQPPPTREEKAATLAALPPELAEIEAMKREGSFTRGDEATLAAGEAEAQRAEQYASAWTTLAGCVARAVA